MKSVSTSELKAKLAKYLRLVRQGELVEIRDRGIPIATIRGIDKGQSLVTIPPSEEPSGIGKLKSQIENVPKTDIVGLLLEDRRKR